MKATRTLAFLFAGLALVMTAIGGFMDAYRADPQPSFQISKAHAWHDGMFLMVSAIFLLLL